jgi:hypothetical protein
MSVKRFVVTIASLLLIASTVFVPSPWNIALNHSTKQCAGYWGGDEFVTYELPDGWEAFEFQYSETFVSAETNIGICKVIKDETNVRLEEACCSQFGYTFVAENIGIRKITSFNLTSQAEMEEFANQNEQVLPVGYYFLFFAIFIILSALVALSIRRSQKEKM